MSQDDPSKVAHDGVDVSAADFKALFESVSNWGRWGDEEERGALNYLTADRVVAATRLVQTGEAVTLSLPLNTRAGVDNGGSDARDDRGRQGRPGRPRRPARRAPTPRGTVARARRARLP